MPIKKDDLVMYEAPAITEYVSSDWLGTILSRYIAWKVNRKYKRYMFRVRRDAFFKKLR